MAVARSDPGALPISASVFDALMQACGPFECGPALAVAVSGGADSMALLRLCHGWAARHGGHVTALTVDHGLRAAAAAEAAQVASWCESLGISHHILRWQPPQMRHGMQEKARAARYGLLSAWCREHHVLHLLTAHTRDDQCETLFFRLGRGSGMEGLSAMPLVSDVEGVRLLRPLLGQGKAALMAMLESLGQAWLEDESNRNPTYTRNRLRQQLARSNDYGRLSTQAVMLAEDFADVRNNLFFHDLSVLAELVCLFPEGYASIDAHGFGLLPDTVRTRLLSALIPALSGGYHPPRISALTRLQAALAEGRNSSLAGFIFRAHKERLLVIREKAAYPAPMALTGPWQGVWDGRFSLMYEGCAPLTLAPLGSRGLAMLSGQFSRAGRPEAALRALPALWHLEEPVACPHIPYQHPDFGHIRFKALLFSLKPLAGRPFFSLNTMIQNLRKEHPSCPI